MAVESSRQEIVFGTRRAKPNPLFVKKGPLFSKLLYNPVKCPRCEKGGPITDLPFVVCQACCGSWR